MFRDKEELNDGKVEEIERWNHILDSRNCFLDSSQR